MRGTSLGQLVLRDARRGVATSKVVGVVVDPARRVSITRTGVPVDGHTLRITDAGRLTLRQRRQRRVGAGTD